MRYFTSAITGVIAGLGAAVIWIIVAFVIPLWAPYLLSRITGEGGMAAASIDSNSILAAAGIGFVGGFVWRLRRSRT